MSRQGKDRQKLVEVLEKLVNGISLDPKYQDHNLHGKWKGYRECHIEPDWLLIYQIIKSNNQLHLVRTGSHSELFNEDIQQDLSISQLNEIITKYI